MRSIALQRIMDNDRYAAGRSIASPSRTYDPKLEPESFPNVLYWTTSIVEDRPDITLEEGRVFGICIKLDTIELSIPTSRLSDASNTASIMARYASKRGLPGNEYHEIYGRTVGISSTSTSLHAKIVSTANGPRTADTGDNAGMKNQEDEVPEASRIRVPTSPRKEAPLTPLGSPLRDFIDPLAREVETPSGDPFPFNADGAGYDETDDEGGMDEPEMGNEGMDGSRSGDKRRNQDSESIVTPRPQTTPRLVADSMQADRSTERIITPRNRQQKGGSQAPIAKLPGPPPPHLPHHRLLQGLERCLRCQKTETECWWESGRCENCKKGRTCELAKQRSMVDSQPLRILESSFANITKQAEQDGLDEIAETARQCQRDRAVFEFRNHGMRSLTEVPVQESDESDSSDE